MLSTKGIVVQVTLVNPNIMQKLDGVNITIQIKLQKHLNTSETISTIVLHDYYFKCSK